MFDSSKKFVKTLSAWASLHKATPKPISSTLNKPEILANLSLSYFSKGFHRLALAAYFWLWPALSINKSRWKAIDWCQYKASSLLLFHSSSIRYCTLATIETSVHLADAKHYIRTACVRYLIDSRERRRGREKERARDCIRLQLKCVYVSSQRMMVTSYNNGLLNGFVFRVQAEEKVKTAKRERTHIV